MSLPRIAHAALVALVTTACNSGPYVDKGEGPPKNKVFVAEGPL